MCVANPKLPDPKMPAERAAERDPDVAKVRSEQQLAARVRAGKGPATVLGGAAGEQTPTAKKTLLGQ